jgi:branched-chain amino acid transport system ATP-binding protein
MLDVKTLASGYGKSQVLFDVSFTLNPGEVICLLGRNGMGKTTTIRTITGTLPPWSGHIALQNRDIAKLSASRIARLGVGLVPEGRQIFPNLTAHENLLVGAANRHNHPNNWTTERVYDLFPALRGRRHAQGNLLSGGEQQMLAIGRALMTNPSILILDEATEGLAPVIRAQIWDCLSQLRGLGQSILIIDKHLKKLLALADRFYVLEKGRTVWSGNAEDVRRDYTQVMRQIAV